MRTEYVIINVINYVLIVGHNLKIVKLVDYVMSVSGINIIQIKLHVGGTGNIVDGSLAGSICNDCATEFEIIPVN